MLSTLGIVVLIVLIFSTIIQIGFIILVFAKLAFYKSQKKEIYCSEPASIIIAARNELNNLKKYLDLILNQEYKLFEVIVVNDGSTDGSEEWLVNKAREDERLKIINRKGKEKSKKQSITEGINQAQYPLLLFTDADCKIESKNWISLMVQHLDEKKSITLGYGPYFKSEGIMNKLIRLDSVLIAANYLSFALCKQPYMGVGRNLSYKKQLWLDNKGFSTHSHIISGDDDLFISEVAGRSNTAIEINPASFAYSHAKPSLNEWIIQKSRHLSTFNNYSYKSKLLLNLYNISLLLFFGMLLISFFVTLNTGLPVLIYLMRLIPQIIVFGIIMNRLKEKDLLILTPLLEPVLMFMYTLFIYKSATNKTIIWK